MRAPKESKAPKEDRTASRGRSEGPKEKKERKEANERKKGLAVPTMEPRQGGIQQLLLDRPQSRWEPFQKLLKVFDVEPAFTPLKSEDQEPSTTTSTKGREATPSTSSDPKGHGRASGEAAQSSGTEKGESQQGRVGAQSSRTRRCAAPRRPKEQGDIPQAPPKAKRDGQELLADDE